MVGVNAVFSFSPGVVLRTFGDEGIVVDLDTETIYALNDTAARIADLIAQGRSVGDILTHLQAEFDADVHQLTQDVRQLVQALADRRLIIEVEPRDGHDRR
jgi:hypothetical protein